MGKLGIRPIVIFGGIMPCRDGYLQFTFHEDHQFRALVKLMGDPDYYDAKIAGWWLWGICQWIGSGWCSGQGPWRVLPVQVIVNTAAPDSAPSRRSDSAALASASA